MNGWKTAWRKTSPFSSAPAYALDVLMIVGFGYHFVTTGVRVYRRLWTRK